MNARQKGIYTVEFAIVGTALFIILFGAIEVARAMFAYNTIAEATRRGARVAAVCSAGDVATAKRAAVFSTGGDASPILNGLNVSNVNVEYLGANVSGEACSAPATGGNIQCVRVSITGYQHELLIPFVGSTLPETVFRSSTTIPAESLGYAPPGPNPCT
jgi:Flp pilus assembly protein TadG